MFGLFKKKEESLEEILKSNHLHAFSNIDKRNWDLVLGVSLGLIFPAQYAFSLLFEEEDSDWEVDMKKGKIYIGSQNYDIQFIGSQSNVDNTWLWGWENINAYKEEIVANINYVNRVGQAWENPVLTQPMQKVGTNTYDHAFASVACALTKEPVIYFACPHDKGTAMVMIVNPPSQVFDPIPMERFMGLVTHGISEYDLDNALYIESILYGQNISYEWKDDLTLLAKFDKNLYINFKLEGQEYLVDTMSFEN